MDTKKKGLVLITGGGRGIGASISMRLAHEGWDLFLVGRDLSSLNTTKEAIQQESASVVSLFACDLARPEAARQVVDACLSQVGVPSALVCNAGNYGELRTFNNCDFKRWADSFQLNFFASAELVHLMLKKWTEPTKNLGSASPKRKIVMLSGNGLGGKKIWPGTSSYGCAKAAIYRLTEIVHAETRDEGITINCVAPGAVLSGMTHQALAAGEEAIGALYSDSLRQSQGQSGDSPLLAAEMVAWLLSSAADDISGRLLSAKWDKSLQEDPSHCTAVAKSDHLYRLLRIDNELFAAKP